MQIYEEDLKRIMGFDNFEEVLHVGLWSFGRRCIQILYTCGVGIEFMVDANPWRSQKDWGINLFKETLHVRMRGLGRNSIWSKHARGFGRIDFWWMWILEDESRRMKENFQRGLEVLGTFIKIARHWRSFFRALEDWDSFKRIFQFRSWVEAMLMLHCKIASVAQILL